MLRGVIAEQLRPIALQDEVNGGPPVLVLSDRRRLHLVAAEQRRRGLEVEDLALLDLGLAERHEVESTGLSDEGPDRVGIGNARHLHHDAVGSLGRHDRLRDAASVDPALDDVLDDGHVARAWLLALDRLGLVLDPQSAFQVEPELRADLSPAPVGARGVGHGQSGEEVHEQGEHAEDQDEGGASSTHRGGMLHEMPAALCPPPRAAGTYAATTRPGWP